MAKHVCPWWLAYTFDNPLRRLFHRPESMFAPYLGKGMTVADFGCGLGYFSIGMAKIVGDHGRVIAVDIQQKMLDILLKRAEKAGVAHVISTHVCNENDLGVSEEAVDFALAFWMAHETPNEEEFLKQVYSSLKKSGKLFLAEPKLHVSTTDFEKTLKSAHEVGFKIWQSPQTAFSHSAAFVKP